MQENLRINVKLNLKDIRSYSNSKVLKNIFNIIFVILIGLIAMSTILMMIGEILLSQNFITKMNTFLIFTLLFLFILVIQSLPVFISYMLKRSKFRKNKQLGNLYCYEFMEDGIKCGSSDGSRHVSWTEVLKIQELKPCFLICTAQNSFLIIPRRCFHSADELDIFFNLIKNKADSGKLKYKKYKTQKFSPDCVDTL